MVNSCAAETVGLYGFKHGLDQYITTNFEKVVFGRCLKLEIALAIPASNE